MKKRYFIYHESKVLLSSGMIGNVIIKYRNQPTEGYDYEYEVENVIKKLMVGGGPESLINYTIIKMYLQTND